MARDPRHDVLFEPVQIGPVTTRNRFYQVPHCSGTGDWARRAVARMRATKAEGGWAVVCTEVTEIHPSTELHPFPSLHLWDDSDIPRQAVMVDEVHAHGALAGVQLGHFGVAAGNRFSRTPTPGPSSRPTLESVEPVQSYVMDKRDIRAFRQWHRDAAVRAKKAGFDIVYVYAAHGLTLPFHFLSRDYNQRSDEYGGSLENRARLLRELIEDTKEAVGDTCAVALRFAVDELRGEEGISCQGEGREVVEMLAELPDLWDVNISDWSNDSETSRFAKEGFQEPFVSFVKRVTNKPVVGVGRFTTPDAMVSQIKRGVLDLIGAARPSIADPFLPRKIDEGRIEDIRECIGCNVCVSGEMSYSPMRCTQNPAIMEEWRRGWHPEQIAPRGSDDAILVIGAGPAGLECAHALGKRGYAVTLAEARDELGGRVTLESRLPGLAEWGRVRDYREAQINALANVEIFLKSPLDAEQVLEFGAPRVVVATGARWRRDGIGRSQMQPVPGWQADHVTTPDDILQGAHLEGEVVVFDDEGAYLGSLIAEKLRAAGCGVTLVTPAPQVARWTVLTLEQHKICTRLLEQGVRIVTQQTLAAIHADHVELRCVYNHRPQQLAAERVVMIASREPNDELHRELVEHPDTLADRGIRSVDRIGDCHAPHLIAAAVFDGHRYARDLDGDGADWGFRREHVDVA
jgi:dimethylamine/trimethylamine dehydrogenase